jgi:pimeloyl-ACP methyl ester carboxylesterase
MTVVDVMVDRTFAGAGVQLRASCFGTTTDPPVLLLHGAGQTRHSWKTTASLLARMGFYAVALDMRGHGDSEWAHDGDYSRQALVRDLIAVCGQLEDAPALVGASSGGATSLVAAGERLIDVWALVLVDITPRIEHDGAERVLQFMKGSPDGFANLQEAADAVAGYMPHRPRVRDSAGLAKNLRQREDGRYRWHWDPRFLTGALEERLTRATRLERAAGTLPCPTLLVRGALSDLVSEEGVVEFLALAPAAEFIDVSDAGHMVAGDRNDVFGEAVIDFLRAHRSVQREECG